MRIKPDDKKIRSFTKSYWRQGRQVLYQNSRKVVDLIGSVPIDQVKARAENMLDSVELRDYLMGIWVETGSFFARDMSSRIVQRKDMWEEAYRIYMEQRIIAKAAGIARTEATLMNSVIDLVIQEGYAEGYSIDRLTDRMMGELSKRMATVHNWEAERIARTEVIGAANKGSFDGASSVGLDVKKGWLTIGRGDVRETHQAYEGMGFVPMNYDYNIGLKHPGDPAGSPEEVINCYTGDTEIKSYIVGGQKSYYSGKMIEIITVGGKRLTVTPNHNILTENGFVRACELTNLHNLVCHIKQTKGFMTKIRNHINKKKSLAANVFRTISKFWFVERVKVGALNFNGDGRFMNKYIDVVKANRELLINSVMFFKDRGKFWFKKSRAQRFLIESFCSFHFGFNRVLCATNSFMSFLYLPLALGRRHFRPFEFFSIGTPPDIDASIYEMTAEGYSHDTGFATKLLEAHSGLVSLDKVSEIRDFDFSGHVYDFTSLTGTNIANNIYTSNCRCTIIYEI